MDIEDDEILGLFIEGDLAAEPGNFQTAFGSVFGFDFFHRLLIMPPGFVFVSPQYVTNSQKVNASRKAAKIAKLT